MFNSGFSNHFVYEIVVYFYSYCFLLHICLCYLHLCHSLKKILFQLSFALKAARSCNPWYVTILTSWFDWVWISAKINFYSNFRSFERDFPTFSMQFIQQAGLFHCDFIKWSSFVILWVKEKLQTCFIQRKV